MEVTWIIVGSRDEVRILEMRRPDEELHDVLDLGNPTGVLKNKDITSDEPGRAFGNMRPGKHAYSSEQEPRERLLQNFYREILRQVDTAFSHHRFTRLVLVAEPHLLGLIRSLLSEQVAHVVHAEVHKDVTYEGSREIRERVRAVM
jgi:protein required for attachment to host cells